MGATNNYSMTKPAGTDKYDVSILNGNFDIIDSQMKIQSNDIKANEDAIEDIEATVSTLQTNLSKVEEDVNQLKNAKGAVTVLCNATGLSQSVWTKKDLSDSLDNYGYIVVEAYNANNESRPEIVNMIPIGTLELHKTEQNYLRWSNGLDSGGFYCDVHYDSKTSICVRRFTADINIIIYGVK